MFNEIAELIFVTSGVIVILLLLLTMRRLSERDRIAASASAFGLFLCGGYAALIQSGGNWLFALGVASLMVGLAYTSLRSEREPQIGA